MKPPKRPAAPPPPRRRYGRIALVVFLAFVAVVGLYYKFVFWPQVELQRRQAERTLAMLEADEARAGTPSPPLGTKAPARPAPLPPPPAIKVAEPTPLPPPPPVKDPKPAPPAFAIDHAGGMRATASVDAIAKGLAAPRAAVDVQAPVALVQSAAPVLLDASLDPKAVVAWMLDLRQAGTFQLQVLAWHGTLRAMWMPQSGPPPAELRGLLSRTRDLAPGSPLLETGPAAPGTSLLLVLENPGRQTAFAQVSLRVQGAGLPAPPPIEPFGFPIAWDASSSFGVPVPPGWDVRRSGDPSTPLVLGNGRGGYGLLRVAPLPEGFGGRTAPRWEDVLKAAREELLLLYKRADLSYKDYRLAGSRPTLLSLWSVADAQGPATVVQMRVATADRLHTLSCFLPASSMNDLRQVELAARELRVTK